MTLKYVRKRVFLIHQQYCREQSLEEERLKTSLIFFEMWTDMLCVPPLPYAHVRVLAKCELKHIL